MRPGIDDFVVALAVGDVAGLVRALEALHAIGRLGEQRLLVARDVQVLDPDRHAAARGVGEAELLEAIEELDRLGEASLAEGLEDELPECLLLHVAVLERHLVRDDRVEQHAPDRGGDPLLLAIAIQVVADRGVVLHAPHRQRRLDFGGAAVRLERGDQLRILSGLVEVGRLLGREVAAEHDVLRRLRDRASVGRLEDVVRRQHEQACLELCLERERNVHGHLVTVEVGVERRADERVNTNGLPLDEHRLERLDAQAVECRRAVEEDRMVLDDLFEDLVHLGALALDDLLGALDRLGDPLLHELVDDERLEQLQCHRLGEAALVQLELGTHDDDRTPGVVDALA